MSLKEDFNATNTEDAFYKNNDFVLTYSPNSSYQCTYDFLSRTMVAHGDSDGFALNVTPFSQLDPESLEFMRDKLIELGGKPPAIAQSSQTMPKQAPAARLA